MKVIAAQKDKQKCKRKKVQLYHSLSSNNNNNNKCKEYSQDTVSYRMKLIVDQYGDEWHKYIINLFVGQRIEVLFGDGWHK